jgi:hypothetical protein
MMANIRNKIAKIHRLPDLSDCILVFFAITTAINNPNCTLRIKSPKLGNRDPKLKKLALKRSDEYKTG